MKAVSFPFLRSVLQISRVLFLDLTFLSNQNVLAGIYKIEMVLFTILNVLDINLKLDLFQQSRTSTCVI